MHPSVQEIVDGMRLFALKFRLASTRYVGFQVLQSALSQHLDYCLINLNTLIITSYLHFSRNEKDPKNLLVSFELNTRISTYFKIDDFAEDLFDSVFCYFPISFRAPENDPYKITGEQLKQALRDCLSANALYAKDAFPNLIEKLSSPSPNVKLDVLNTINQCIVKYDTKTVEEYWITLWNSLKFEILHNEIATAEDLTSLFKYYENAESEDERVIPAVLTIFQSLGNKLANDEESANIQDYLILIVDELSKFIKSPEDKKSKQSTIILSAICSSNLNVYNLLVPKILPVLLSSSTEGSLNIKSQRLLMVNVSFILDSYYKLFNEGSLKVEQSNPMLQYKDEVLMMINQSLLSTSQLEVSLRCLAIKLIAKLFSLTSFLSVQECQLIAQTLTEVLLNDNNSTTFDQTLASLNSISKNYPNVILESTLPKLLVLLPDNDISEEVRQINTSHSKEKVLDIFLSVCENKLIVDSLLIRLLSKLESLINNKASRSYFRSVLLALSKILNKLHDDDSTNDYLKKFSPRFLSLILEQACFSPTSAIYRDEVSLDYSGRILKKVLVNCDLSLHQPFLDETFDIFYKGKTESSLLAKPLAGQINITKGNFSLFALFSKIFSSFDKSTTLPIEATDFSDLLLTTLDNESSIFERQSTLQTLSLLVNKWFSKDCEPYLETKFNEFTAVLVDQSSSRISKFKVLENLTWITKALLIKNDKFTDKFQSYLASLLESPEFSDITPKVLEILIADSECFDTFRKKGAFGKPAVFNVNIRLLYKQKFFDSILPTLITKFKDSPSNKNYLTALSLILKYIDKNIILPHLESVLPLVLTSLNLKSDLIVSSSLSILRIAVSESPDLVIRQLSTIIPNLVKLLNSNRNEEVKCRSLECLMSLVQFELHLLIPYRLPIINGLVIVLDDDRRTVRKMACDCRQIYYELGQPKAEM